jgi:hypothetical protein
VVVVVMVLVVEKLFSSPFCTHRQPLLNLETGANSSTKLPIH